MEFEKRKQEYLERINSNEEILNEMKEHFRKSFKDAEDRIELIVNPKNEKELLLAEPLYTFFVDMLLLTKRIDNEEVIEIPFEESEGVQILTNSIRAIMNGDEDITIFDSTLPPKVLAKHIYEVFVSMADSDGLSNYIMEKLEINPRSLKELVSYLNAWLKFTEILQKFKSNDPLSTDILNYTEEDLNRINEFTDAFHELCENGKKEKTDVERLAALLTEMFMNYFENNDKHLK